MRMSDLIEIVHERQTKTLRQRVAVRLKGFFARVTWRLWGRRRALAKMQRLALSQPPLGFQPSLTAEQIEKDRQRIMAQREYYDSFRVSIPPPDSTDTN